MIDRILKTLRQIRAPFSVNEYDLHQTVKNALENQGISCEHEAVLAPGCRIDLLCGDIGIEIKRGRPTRKTVLKQIERYVRTGKISAFIIVTEQNIVLPDTVLYVPLFSISLFKLWGVANDADSSGASADDCQISKADLAIKNAREALGIQTAGFLTTEDYSDNDVPAYLQDSLSAGHIYGTISYNAKRRCWTVRADPFVTELCKRIFPGSDRGKRGEVTFSDHRRIVGDLNWLMMRYPMAVAARDKDRWQKALDSARAYAAERIRMLDHPREMEPPEGMFAGSLRAFQRQGVAWICSTVRGLLADEMGLGKTLQALCALCCMKSFPAVIVVPPHLVRNWIAEIKRFIRIDGTEPCIHELKGLTPYPLPDADIYIVHYLLLRGWKNYLPEFRFKAVIFDEAQELRHSGTEKYSAASLLSESCERVIGLSGTPIYNQGGEIWNVINILDYHFLGDWESFTREWCYGYGNNIVVKPELLGKYLRQEGIMLRRTKAEVLPELPEKRRLVQEIDTDDKMYMNMMRPVLEKMRLLRDCETLTAASKALLIDQISQGERQATGIAKSAFVCQFIRTLMDNDQKVLLFAYHHAVIDRYKEELHTFHPVFITGRESGAEKECAARSFMEGATDLCVVSLRAASGLNLQRATCVVFGELDWSPAVHSQAEDRAHRIGQKDSLLCYYLVSPGGSDSAVQEALGLKVSQFVGLMGEKPITADQIESSSAAAKRFVEKMVEKYMYIDEFDKHVQMF